MKKIKTADFIIGLIFTVIGLISFLRSVNVGSFHFRELWGINTGAVVILLIMASLMALIIKPNLLTKILLVISVIMLIIAIILSVKITIQRMSVLSLIVMLGMLFGGVALMLRSFLSTNKKEEEKK